MSYTVVKSDRFSYLLGKGQIDMDVHEFSARLYTSSLVHSSSISDPANISSYEVATGNGYASGGVVLSGGVWTQGTPSFRQFNDVIWESTSVIGYKTLVVIDTTADVIAIAYVSGVNILIETGQTVSFSLRLQV